MSDAFYVFDIETTCLSPRPENFVIGCIYGESGGYKKVFYSPEQMKKEFELDRYRGKVLFAHNAEFDITGIYGNVFTLDPNAIFVGSKFVFAKGIKAKFGNSYAVLPTSVRELGESLKFPKGETPLEDLANRNITNEMIEYCFRDCEIVYEALLKLFALNNNINYTIGSASLFYFRSMYQKNNIYYDHNVYNFFDSYYGGRVEAFRIGVLPNPAVKYDINSLYPNAMLGEYPQPNNIRLARGNKKLSYYLEYYEGCAELTIEHRNTNFGYLPYRGESKLLFPAGRFTGIWNFPEIRYALDRGIIKVLDTKKVWYSPTEESPFKDFVLDLYQQRLESEPIWAYIYKLYLNNLYGKFAQTIKSKMTYYEEFPWEIVAEAESRGERLNIYMLNPENDNTCLISETLLEPIYQQHTIPSYSSYTTTYGRLQLLDKLIQYQDFRPVYVDTDSIAFLDDPMIPNSVKLGDFKKEKRRILVIGGNKNYIEIDSEGKKYLKIKGIPKNALDKGNGVFEMTKIAKTKEAMKRGFEPGKLITMSKHLTAQYDKRIVLSNGETKIITLL